MRLRQSSGTTTGQQPRGQRAIAERPPDRGGGCDGYPGLINNLGLQVQEEFKTSAVVSTLVGVYCRPTGTEGPVEWHAETAEPLSGTGFPAMGCSLAAIGLGSVLV